MALKKIQQMLKVESARLLSTFFLISIKVLNYRETTFVQVFRKKALCHLVSVEHTSHGNHMYKSEKSINGIHINASFEFLIFITFSLVFDRQCKVSFH